MKHNTIYDGDKPLSVLVYHEGRSYVADAHHPNFPAIIDALEQGRSSDEVIDLFDTSSALARGFRLARNLIKAVADKTVTRITASTHDDEPVRHDEVRDLAKKVLPTAVVADDDLDTLTQKELWALVKRMGLGSPVGETKESLRQRIRQARQANLLDVAGRVEVKKDGRLFFDGEEMHGALADAILAFHRQGHKDFTPLVRFMAKLQENPNPHSREHLYQWMQHLSFDIHEDGDLIAYKNVRRFDDGTLRSNHAGPGFVNGVREEHRHLRHNVGDVVSLPREQVTFDPKNGCASGLHIGTVSFAGSGFGGQMIECKINPADVVSVPTENSWQKMRVCKYKVTREITADQAQELRKSALVSA